MPVGPDKKMTAKSKIEISNSHQLIELSAMHKRKPWIGFEVLLFVYDFEYMLAGSVPSDHKILRMHD